jgi:hypothetical protein
MTSVFCLIEKKLKILPQIEETNKAAGRSRAALKLPLLGSNQDSPDPESGVLPVTPRGREGEF